MKKKERLDNVFEGKKSDRPPMLGGWIAAPELLLRITGLTENDYNTNPRSVAIEAYKKLEMDGLISIFTTGSVDIYRCVDNNSYVKADIGMSFDEAVRKVEEMPEADEYERNFNFKEWYENYRNDLINTQKECGNIVYMPACCGE